MLSFIPVHLWLELHMYKIVIGNFHENAFKKKKLSRHKLLGSNKTIAHWQC